MPTDIEMSKVVADLEYVLADSYGLGDDAVDNNIASYCNAAVKVYFMCYS